MTSGFASLRSTEHISCLTDNKCFHSNLRHQGFDHIALEIPDGALSRSVAKCCLLYLLTGSANTN
jgi:hypothetical protein